MADDYSMVEIVKVSKTKSGQYRITLKKKIVEELGVEGGDYLIFLKNDRGEMLIKKLQIGEGQSD